MAQGCSPAHCVEGCVQQHARVCRQLNYEHVYRMLLDLTELPDISCHAEMARQAQNWVLDFRWQGQLAAFVC